MTGYPAYRGRDSVTSLAAASDRHGARPVLRPRKMRGSEYGGHRTRKAEIVYFPSRHRFRDRSVSDPSLRP
jgi:hypothetical protein